MCTFLYCQSTPLEGYIDKKKKTNNSLMYMSSRLNNKKTINVHCRKIYNLFVWALETSRKASILWACVLLLTNVNEYSIFSDNEHILCLSCRVKKAQNNCQIVWKDQKQGRFLRFWWGPLWSPHLYCYRFLPLLNMNQVPESVSTCF